MSTTDHSVEAAELLFRRLDDFRYFLTADYAEADAIEDYDDEHGSVRDYGLSWEHELTNHRTGDETFRHVLSTGGPHDEFIVRFSEGGEVEEVTYAFLPWFDRVEIELVGDDREVAHEFYGRWFGDYAYEVSHNR